MLPTVYQKDEILLQRGLMKDTNVLRENNGSGHIKLANCNISVGTLDGESACMGTLDEVVSTLLRE